MNKINNYILALVLLCLSISAGIAQTVDRSTPPKAGPAPEIRMGKYESFTLKNGLKVFVVTNRKLPRVAYSLVLDYDPILEKEAAGYVSVAGDMLRTGTTTRTKDQLDEEIDFIGASLATSAGGMYGSSLKKHQDKLLTLMADVLMNPAFKQEELDKLKTQMKSGLASQKDNPDAIANRVRKAIVYGNNHPYGENTTEETVDNITLEKVREFYTTYYRPNVGYLAVVGDITLAEARKLVTQHFSGWQRGEVPSVNWENPKLPARTKIVMVDRPASVQSVVNVTHPIVLKPGDQDVIPATIANDILGGAGARLYNNLREQRGLTYGAYSRLQSNKLVGSFNAFANVRNEVTDSAVVEFMHELRRIRTEAVPQDELQKTKNSITGSFARSLESPETIASFAINTARYKLPADYYANYLKRVAAVTPEQVQQVAQKYINPEQAYVMVVGKASEVAPRLKQFGEVEFVDSYGKPATQATSQAAPTGVTVQKVLDNYIEAIGGKTNIAKIKNIAKVTTASLQGRTLTITEYQRMPAGYFMEVKLGDMMVNKIVYNGNQARISGPMGSQNLSGNELNDQKLQFEAIPELNYFGGNMKPELKGIESIDGKQAYRVELTMPSGSKLVNFYAVDSGLKIKQESTQDTPMGSMTQTTLFDNYKAVNGVKFPHTINQTVGPQQIQAELTKLEINSAAVQDALFVIE
jgi:zinc protease